MYGCESAVHRILNGAELCCGGGTVTDGVGWFVQFFLLGLILLLGIDLWIEPSTRRERRGR